MTAPGSFLRWNWALAAAAIVLVGVMCAPLPAIGQQSSQGKTASNQVVTAVGPTDVIEITSEKVILAAARKPVVIEFGDKKVVVKDKDGQETDLSAVSAGMYVTVLTKAKEVNIMVMPKREAQNDKVM